jgi:hypothetical protein
LEEPLVKLLPLSIVLLLGFLGAGARAADSVDLKNFRPSIDNLLVTRSDGTRFIGNGEAIAELLGDASIDSKAAVRKFMGLLDPKFLAAVDFLSQRDREIFLHKNGNAILEKLLVQKALAEEIPLCGFVGLPEFESGRFLYRGANLPADIGGRFKMRSYQDSLCKEEQGARVSQRCKTVRNGNRLQKLCPYEKTSRRVCSDALFDNASDQLKRLLEKESRAKAVLCMTGPYSRVGATIESVNGWLEFVRDDEARGDVLRLASRFPVEGFGRKWTAVEPRFEPEVLIGRWRLFEGNNETNLLLQVTNVDGNLQASATFEKVSELGDDKRSKRGGPGLKKTVADVSDIWRAECSESDDAGACRSGWDLNRITGRFWLTAVGTSGGNVGGSNGASPFEVALSGTVEGEVLRLGAAYLGSTWLFRRVTKEKGSR